MPLGKALGAPELTPEAKRQALDDPGPSWRQWFYRSFLKAYVILGFVILDSWVAGSWAEPSVNLVGLVPSLAFAVYLEVLLYRYLWERPSPEEAADRRRPFRPTWLRPRLFGIWTPEAERAQAGLDPVPGAAAGPDPSEFL